jgi:hypothetical protein
MIVTSGRLTELPEPVAEDTHPMGVPLKFEDRVPLPTQAGVSNGTPVGARTE